MHCAAYVANAERILLSFGNDGRDCDDCGARAIIHASYYALFHFVADALKVQVIGEGYAKHADLWRVLQARAHEKPGLMVARRNFQSLRDLRQVADYDLERRLGFADARDALDFALDVFDEAGIVPQTS